MKRLLCCVIILFTLSVVPPAFGDSPLPTFDEEAVRVYPYMRTGSPDIEVEQKEVKTHEEYREGNTGTEEDPAFFIKTIKLTGYPVLDEKGELRAITAKYCGRSVKEIRLSDFIFSEPEDLFYDTARHEYAHAVVKLRYPTERHVHDAVWKAVCLEVGCNPNRLTSTPAEVRSQREDKSKYVLTCKYCGVQWKFYRKTKLIKYLLAGGNKLACSRCGHADFELVQRDPKRR